jgi:hypothetical protein
MKNAFSALPRDARHAASQGFNFREGSLEVEDDFVEVDKMLRRGTMEVSDDAGNIVEVSFTAEFTFSKLVPIRKSVAA